MGHTDFMSMGRPHGEQRHRTVRAAASIVAASAGACAVLIVSFAVLGGAAAWAWFAAAGLVVVSLTGIWWRWDAPDARDSHHERERRGF